MRAVLTCLARTCLALTCLALILCTTPALAAEVPPASPDRTQVRRPRCGSTVRVCCSCRPCTSRSVIRSRWSMRAEKQLLVDLAAATEDCGRRGDRSPTRVLAQGEGVEHPADPGAIRAPGEPAGSRTPDPPAHARDNGRRQHLSPGTGPAAGGARGTIAPGRRIGSALRSVAPARDAVGCGTQVIHAERGRAHGGGRTQINRHPGHPARAQDRRRTDPVVLDRRDRGRTSLRYLAVGGDPDHDWPELFAEVDQALARVAAIRPGSRSGTLDEFPRIGSSGGAVEVGGRGRRPLASSASARGSAISSTSRSSRMCCDRSRISRRLSGGSLRCPWVPARFPEMKSANFDRKYLRRYKQKVNYGVLREP